MIYRDECYHIVGAYFEVYNDKGCGFLESVYQECLEMEFRHQPHCSQLQEERRHSLLASQHANLL